MKLLKLLFTDKKFLEYVYYGYIAAICLTLGDYFVFKAPSSTAMLVYRFTIFPFLWSLLTMLLAVLFKEFLKSVDEARNLKK